MTDPSTVDSPGGKAPAYRLLPAGDRAVTVEFARIIDPVVNARVRALDAAISATPCPGLVETIPTYRSLQIIYDPVKLSYEDLSGWLAGLVGKGATERPDGETTVRHWTLPVAYGGDNGADLESAAAMLGMTAETLADRHADVAFTVAMIGFQPGFTYLSGLPEDLKLPRMEVPRNTIPAGTVSIGGIQSAISSVLAPSAWHLLGRTPVRPFDLRREDPFLFRPGDHIRFRRIDADEFEHLAGRVEQGDTIVTPENDGNPETPA